MEKQAVWYVNGRWVEPAEATLSLTDISVLRGYSVFEALRTYNQRPFHLEEHLDRLYHSAKLIEMPMPFVREQVAGKIHEIIERNPYRHASIRLLVTGGESKDGILPSGEPGIAIMISELPERDLERFNQGYRLITTRLQRVTPEAKSSNYIAAVRALKEARQRNADDALFVNHLNHLLEGTRSNFFVFKNRTLVTPKQGVLIGVTRNVVLELARHYFPVEERPILMDDLTKITEAFLTSSSREIMPVIKIDDLTLSGGQPGPNTRELEQHFIEMVEQGKF